MSLRIFFPQENREIIRKRTKRSWENNHRTIARDTRGPDEITQEDLDNVADFSTRKVYNQVTVSILDRAVFRLQITAYWVNTAVTMGGSGVYVVILKFGFITARVRSTTGGYVFTLFTICGAGGTYLPGGGGLPTQVWVGGYLPSRWWGGTYSGLGGGTAPPPPPQAE